MVDHIQAMQEEVRQKLETTNAKYKEAVDKKRCDKIFSVGGLVLVYLKKERFPAGTYNKLKGKKYRPFQITKKITNNDCVVALPTDMNISSTFNVAHLYDYYPLDVPGNGNSGSSSFQVGEIDVEQAVMAFLDSCALLKTMRKAKRHQQKSWASELELHEIWWAEAKWPSKQQSLHCHELPL